MKSDTTFGSPRLGMHGGVKAKNIGLLEGKITALDEEAGTFSLDLEAITGAERYPTQTEEARKFKLGEHPLHGRDGSIRVERVGLLGQKIKLLEHDPDIHPGATHLLFEREVEGKTRMLPIVLWVEEITMTERSFTAIAEIVPLRRD
jgi:hypothetical protein